MVVKIENILGFDQSIWVKNKRIIEIVWPDDQHFVVDRHYKAGHGTKETPAERSSEEFIAKRVKKGDNIEAQNIFTVFQIVSVALLALLIILLIV